jgi:primase-polymerase (primpol)-like protein
MSIDNYTLDVDLRSMSGLLFDALYDRDTGSARPECVVPLDLRHRPQWLSWRYECRDGKWTKVPYVPRGSSLVRASTTDPSTWGTYCQSLEYLASTPELQGIGFVFSRSDPHAGIDLDKCRNPQTGEIEAWAQAIIDRVKSYTEISPSGTGVKIFAKGDLPPGGRRKGRIETYDEGRYFTVTAQHLAGTPLTIEARQDELDALHAEVFGTRRPTPDRPTVSILDNLDDAAIIRKAKAAANGEKFEKLWDGDWSDYESQSEADLALCSTLAFYAGPDPERVNALFCQSGLHRDKWDERHHGDGRTYGEGTVEKAIAGKSAYYGEISADGADGADGVAAPQRGGNRSQADLLIEVAEQAVLFHDEFDEAFARVQVNDHHETWSVKSNKFQGWLAREFYRTYGKAVGREAKQEAEALLTARAQFDGEQRTVHLRVAPDGDGGLYIDLGDESWRAVHVTREGWRVVSNPPVCFRRPAGLQPLPDPERGGSLEQLRSFVNVPDDDAWALLKAWLVAALWESGPYPILALYGEQGSAKSTTAVMLRKLVDPAKPQLRGNPREEEDLAIASKANRVLAFDNLSSIQQWLSDALCRVATGGGWGTRKRYTVEDEALFEAQRPILMTGITEFITRGDLLDRTVQVTLSPISDDTRRSEKELWAAYDEAWPRMFGAVLDRLAGALREYPHVRLDRRPRMADFALVAVAAEQAASEEPRFLRALEGIRATAHDQAVEASIVGGPLMEFMARSAQGDGWRGTMQQLLSGLNENVDEQTRRHRGWPTGPRKLSDEIRRLAPSLRGLGFTVKLDDGREGHQGDR